VKQIPPILFIANDDTRIGTSSGRLLARLADAVRALDYEVLIASSGDEGLAEVESRLIFGAIVIDWSLPGGPEFPFGAAAEIVRSVRKRNPLIPIFLALGRTPVREIPWDVIHDVREYIHLLNEAPASTADRVDFAVRQYLAALLPRYFNALMQEADLGSNQWDAPGHQAGEAYRRHPIGMQLRHVFGEAILRADLGVRLSGSVFWSSQERALADSERRAARVFGAQWTLYGAGGLSASNRVAVSGLVAHGDLVLCDRTSDRSIFDAFALSGARPVYLTPSCNAYGMLGPIPFRQLTSAHVAELIAGSPLSSGVASSITFGTIKNCTRDGLCYDVTRMVRRLGGAVPRLLFDESNFGHAHFSPLFHGRYAMSIPAEDPGRPTLFAVHSASTVLSALSMSTLIHARPSPRAPVDEHTFQRAFRMHNTPTPFLPILASIDVVTAMMMPPAGQRMVEDTLIDAVTFRQLVAGTKRRFADEGDLEDWFFDVYQPDRFTDRVTRESLAFADAPVQDLLADARHWTLNPSDKWHGFDNDAVDDGLCMLDPLKVTLLCPGIDAAGRLQQRGIPAAIVTRFLAERRTFVARAGDYTLLLVFSVGAGEQKWGSLLRALHAFKRAYDDDTSVDEVMPDLASAHPRYGRLSLRALCDTMHARMRALGVSRVAREAVAKIPEQVLTPFAAHQQLIRGGGNRVPLAQFANLIAADHIVVHPPGSTILAPGERMGGPDSPAMKLLTALETLDKEFPGFPHELHGVQRDDEHNYYLHALAERPVQRAAPKPSSMEQKPTRSRKRASR
jgi:arginine decarboxylase